MSTRQLGRRPSTRAWRGVIGSLAVVGVLAAGTSCVSPGIPCKGMLQNSSDAITEVSTRMAVGTAAWEMTPLAERIQLWFWLVWALGQPRWAEGDVQPYSASRDVRCSSTVWVGTEIPAAVPTSAPPSTTTTTVQAPAITYSYHYPGVGPITGGTSVTIVGSGFTGVTSVIFDGVPGTSLNVQDDNHLTVVTPPHAAGSVPIVISKPGRTAAAGTYLYEES